ncbi:hypothetical protein Tco_1416321 [Tanacetum coccineum]
MRRFEASGDYLLASKGKDVNMAAGDSNDALVCCVKNTVEDCIMDSGASFHATYCKEELDRFRLRSGKVHLAYDKTLDIAGIGDVVFKTSFGTSWTLKDVSEDKKTAEFRASSHRRLITYIYCINLRIRYYDTVIEDCNRSCGRYITNLQVKCLKFDNGGEYSS